MIDKNNSAKVGCKRRSALFIISHPTHHTCTEGVGELTIFGLQVLSASTLLHLRGEYYRFDSLDPQSSRTMCDNDGAAQSHISSYILRWSVCSKETRCPQGCKNPLFIVVGCLTRHAEGYMICVCVWNYRTQLYNDFKNKTLTLILCFFLPLLIKVVECVFF